MQNLLLYWANQIVSTYTVYFKFSTDFFLQILLGKPLMQQYRVHNMHLV